MPVKFECCDANDSVFFGLVMGCERHFRGLQGMTVDMKPAESRVRNA